MQNNKGNIAGTALALAVIAIVIAGVALFVNPAADSSSQLAKVGQGQDKGNKGNNSSGSVWADLQAKGLQGEHFTLNIHGKKDTFNKSDCTVEPDPITGEYSNNIFIPSNSDSAVKNQIIMTSGNAKGKWATGGDTTYGVRDGCTAPFDGDAAELTLPPNDKGYYVVARVLGKPTNNPEISLEGDLVFVEDETGNDLLVLGLVTDDGFETPTQTLSRTKGKVKAVDITGLFEWSGSVCYFDTTNYCYNDFDEYTCTDRSTCCTDTNLDGVYDECVDPLLDDEGVEYCASGDASLLTVGCQDYLNEWVFNIGDFVGYMWDAYTGGDFKLVNIRFYAVK